MFAVCQELIELLEDERFEDDEVQGLVPYDIYNDLYRSL